MDQKYVVITGVSTGIGLASAQRLVKAGYHVFGSVRKTEDGMKVQALLGHDFTPLLFDVCDTEAIKKAVEIVKTALNGKTLSALVNNAGIALGGPLLEIPIQMLKTQLEVNVIGLFAVTQAFAPLLGADIHQKQPSTSPGKVINIGSVSGVRAMPFMGPYTASKYALEGLNDSMRMELLPYGVDVILIQPGPIQTAIWDKAPTPENNEFNQSPYQSPMTAFYHLAVGTGKKGLVADEIASIVQDAIECKKAKTRYLKTPGYFTRYFLPKILTARVFDRIIGKMLGLLPHLFWKK